MNRHGQLRALLLAVAAAGLFGWWSAADRVGMGQALLSYLAAYVYWFGLSIGGLAVLMLHGLTGGAWGKAAGPGLQAAMRLLPLMAVLFLPLGLGVRRLYPWASPDGADMAGWYLNAGSFQLRAAVYFAVWLGLAHGMARGPVDTGSAARWAAPGLVLFGFSVSFAAVDWLMSLMPQWHSAVFGLQVGVSHLLAALALGIVCAEPSVEPARRIDLGNLLLMLLLAWGYLAFMQYLTIWMADLPQEIVWYLPRVRGGWCGLSLVVIVFQCVLPSLLLLFRRLKRDRLPAIAALVLAANLAQSLWLVLPSVRPPGLLWSDAAAMLGVGGLWLWAFFGRWRRPAVLAGADHG